MIEPLRAGAKGCDKEGSVVMMLSLQKLALRPLLTLFLHRLSPSPSLEMPLSLNAFKWRQ